MGAGGIDEGLVDVVAEIPGVKTAAPLIQRPTILYFQGQRVKLLSLGIDPAKHKEVHDFVLAEGESLEDVSGILLEAAVAKRVDAKPGDTVRLLTRQGLTRARLVGLFRSAGPIAVEGGAAMLMRIRSAQYAAKMPGEIHLVQVVLEPGADDQAVANAIEERLPAGVQIARPAARSSFAEETALSIRQGLRTSRAFLLLVATLIIANTYLINVMQRRRQFGILRAIGATQGQIARMLAGEAVWMGLLGALLGWVAGTIGAHYLTRGMGSLYETSLPAIEITPMSFALAAMFGILISLLGIWIPARRASRLQPIEAMQEGTTATIEAGARWPIWLGLGLVVIGGASLAASINGRLPMELSVWAGVLVLTGLVFLMQAIVPTR